MSTWSAKDGPDAALGRSFGAFHLELLLQRLDVDPVEHLDSVRTEAFKRQHPSIAEQRDYALGQTALLHEERHFHDVFGTRAGISLFELNCKVLEEFAKTSYWLAAQGRQWPLPVQDGEDAALQGRPARFLHFAMMARRLTRRFRGAVPSPTQGVEALPSPLPHVSQLREDDLQTMVYAFPAHVHVLGAAGVANEQLIHIPVALDAMLEGNAQALQRSWAESQWGAEVAEDLFLHAGMGVRPVGDAFAMPAYNTTDLMVSRFVQNEAGDGQYPRSALLALADHSLAASAVGLKWQPDGGLRAELECPGHAFVHLLKEFGADAIRRDSVPPPKDEGYRALRDQFAALPPFDAPHRALPPLLEDVLMLYRWVAHAIIVPLLDARLATAHRVFSDLNVWLKQYPHLPITPFRVRRDGLLRTWAPEPVRDAWVRLRMLDAVMRQLVGGETGILCPRAHRLVPGLETLNLAWTGHCDDFMAGDLCGRYTAEMPRAALPDCLFADVLKAAALLPPQ